MLNKKILLCILVASSLQACTWIDLTPEGEKVRVLAADEVSSCKKLGIVRTTLKDKVIGVERNSKKVKKEMEALARNSAVDLGGDTVVPASEISDGKQAFDVYKCVNP